MNNQKLQDLYERKKCLQGNFDYLTENVQYVKGLIEGVDKEIKDQSGINTIMNSMQDYIVVTDVTYVDSCAFIWELRSPEHTLYLEKRNISFKVDGLSNTHFFNVYVTSEAATKIDVQRN